MNWPETRVLVAGGASFLGSTLVDALVARDARVRVVDNLTSGRLDYLRGHLAAASIEFIEADLLDSGVARQAVQDIHLVFHLAGSHDQCASIRRSQSTCSTSLALDGLLFRACSRAGVEKVVFVSSGENGEPSGSENLCAWTRRTAELTLRAYAAERWMKTVSCRYFSVYGERVPAHHTAMALIVRALTSSGPLLFGGDNAQLCRWTHVDDVAAGIIFAAERIDDGGSLNLSTSDQVPGSDAARELLRYAHPDAHVHFQTSTIPGPSGPRSAAPRNTIDWKPNITLSEGLRRTVAWHRSVLNDPSADIQRRSSAVPERTTAREPRKVVN